MVGKVEQRTVAATTRIHSDKKINEKVTHRSIIQNRSCWNSWIRLNEIKWKFVNFLALLFERYGRWVASHPWHAILCCLAVTGLSAIGLLRLNLETRTTKLWIPWNSRVRKDSEWLQDNYPPSTRFASLIYESQNNNVLTPQTIQAMYRVHKAIEDINVEIGGKNQTWANRCAKIPIIRPPDMSGEDDDSRRKKRQLPEDLVEFFSANFYPDPYCSIAESTSNQSACLESSILELWANDGSYDNVTDYEIDNLTTDSILERINNVNKSGVILVEKDFISMLGGVERDKSTGQIVSAKATMVTYISEVNVTYAKLNSVSGKSDTIDSITLQFEQAMLDVFQNVTSHEYPTDLQSYPNVQRSFDDIAGETILGDVSMVIVGYVVVFVYVTIVMGRRNLDPTECVDKRFFLANWGLIAVLMGVVTTYGLSSALGLIFSPMHQILPFLLLGIGIDDMFVIFEAFESAKDSNVNSDLKSQIGVTLFHAGLAITVTTITDVLAFGVGSLTILPALHSFCLFAAIGLAAVLFYQSTFFVGWLVIDERRVRARKNFFLPCIKHEVNNESSSGGKCCESQSCLFRPRGSEKGLLKYFFKKYSTILVWTPFRIFVLIGTFIMLGFGIWGNLLLEQGFDVTKFIPSDTYLSKWFDKSVEHFPAGGAKVTVYAYNVNISRNWKILYDLSEEIKNQTDIVSSLDSWMYEFVGYVDRNYDDREEMSDGTFFDEKLVQFLFTPKGARYRATAFTFKGTELNDTRISCGDSTLPEIVLTKFNFQHVVFEGGPPDQIPAMERIFDIINKYDYSLLNEGRIFAQSRQYLTWETDSVIGSELYRNLGLALLAVSITTLVFIANVLVSLLVFCCVVFSLVDILGYMHFWDLPIDTISCVMLVIAIGLCIDYSVHVANAFAFSKGQSRIEKVKDSLQEIGPPVLNGGISTTLAFILLADSKSYVFSTFFKVTALVVIFGLYHGLVFLPVVLSFIGPLDGNLRQDTKTENGEKNDDQRSSMKMKGKGEEESTTTEVVADND